MPLLKKRTFEKASIPEFLRDDEEVFHCAITNEIFRDYEEFCERIILCNSMVWTCCMTGKTNLTYAEALESEENAKKSLEDFPSELKIPVLFIANRTQKTAFGDMADEVFAYIKDRFFLHETVEASFSPNKWKESHIRQVVAPTEDQIKSALKNSKNSADHSNLPAPLYRYEIEQLDADDEDISETMILDFNHIRRRKGVYSKERNKLFLKQYMEHSDKGYWVVKDTIVEDFNIKSIKFSDIFDGPLPDFNPSKKSKVVVNGKKAKQETISKFLSKNNGVKTETKNKISLLEQMKKREEEFKLMKQQKEEEKIAKRQKRKEENVQITSNMRNWYKPKEDLELEDQKKLPAFAPVKSKVPEKYFGDALMVVDFVNTFSKLLYTKTYFPNGLTIELMERALIEKEVAGPLTDIIQMLLITLFKVQDAEALQYKTRLENSSDIKEDDLTNNMSLTEATYLATIASKYSNTYQGMPLGKLPLYTLTVSEVLRLHLLSSGARINETGAKWRYQQRGGYTSEDDPGLYLRLHQPHIIKALALHNVVQLPMGDKLEVLSCLINQLLTYADVRDEVEEHLERSRQIKIDLKTAQSAERKREAEYVGAKFKIKREGKGNPESIAADLEKLDKEAEKKRYVNERKIEDLLKKSASDNQVVLGYDRAFRRYLKVESVPGFFVDCDENNAGICLEKVINQKPELVNMDRNETLAYIRKLYAEEGDNKNNKDVPNKKVNGTLNNFNQKETDSCQELLICSANPETCVVHSTAIEKSKWYFIHTTEQLDELINSLNKRGIRENELQQTLQSYRENISDIIARTPVLQLNPEIEMDEAHKIANRGEKYRKSKYEDVNLGYPSDMEPEEVYHTALIDIILEMEDKIFAGNLGSLKIKDRDAWRECLSKRNYDEFHKFLIKNEVNLKVKKENSNDKGSRSATPDVLVNISKDPGIYLGSTFIESENCNGDIEEDVLYQSENLKQAIECLAIALAQIAEGVDSKYLKRPLGQADMKKDEKKKEEYDILHKWEQSLLASTSFSQVFLHYGTLDSCIKWSRSALLARCRICRRLKDSENMLLCDSCNNGHHLYCLKPKLKSVPPGKWYCDKCKKELKIEKEVEEPVQPVRKKRKIFRDDDEDSSQSEETYEESEETEDDTEVGEEEEEESVDDDKENGNIKIDLCQMCGSGGELLHCKNCSENYHIECVEPPLRRSPRGPWYCNQCKEKRERRSKRDRRHVNGILAQRTGIIYNQRGCAARARHKIHDFAKSLRQMSDTEDSDEEYIVQRRSRREECNDDFPLHNSALHELLSDIMKHADAWPFIRPVLKNEVPDYYDVISKPMDFGTIKYKLNMGEYREDAELMADAALVFENCNTYNDSEALVYKCGQSLLQHFQKKCQELGLKLPKELQDDESTDDVDEPKAKRIRTD